MWSSGLDAKEAEVRFALDVVGGGAESVRADATGLTAALDEEAVGGGLRTTGMIGASVGEAVGGGELQTGQGEDAKEAELRFALDGVAGGGEWVLAGASGSPAD